MTANSSHLRLAKGPARPPGASGLRSHPALDEAQVALVHDWLPVYAGAERVLEQMLHVVPQSELYSLIDFLPRDQRDFLQGREVQTSFIQHLPFAESKYRYYLPLAPIAIEQFDLTAYNVVISSSYAVAKGALTTADQLHISYVHSPIRYAWDLHFEYLREGGLKRGLRSMLARAILHYMRLYDVSTASRPDVMVANSRTVARRIWKTYRREARVIYPPVDTQAFQLYEQKEDFFLTASRLVPYKRIDLIVEAFAGMPDKQLVVVGDGPEMDRIKAKATANVEILGYQSNEALQDYMQRARAFVFAAQEDFGIVPVEAQACGTPVIAYSRGGTGETVLPGETGVFFHRQTVPALQQAVRTFEAQRDTFEPAHIRTHAETFSIERFRDEFQELVRTQYRQFTQP
ncbi:MAG: glycosyltransferase [Bacteroidetes bacterium]|nr:glycosyltransferase [Bacteroidota bacterium]